MVHLLMGDGMTAEQLAKTLASLYLLSPGVDAQGKGYFLLQVFTK